MPAILLSSTLLGIHSILVHVEVDVANGIPAYHVVGLPDPSVQESCERVRSALRNSGSPLPSKRVTVNLSPGDVRKEGPRFDLAIALGVLCAQDEQLAHRLRDTVILGELSLDGSLRPVRGMLSAALDARSRGYRRLLVPAANRAEAELVEGMRVLAVDSLQHACACLRGRGQPSSGTGPREPSRPEASAPDLECVKGQHGARRALEVAAAGGHHMAMIGAPGAGKTLLASCLPGLLPPLSYDESLEVTRVHSVCRPEQGLITTRPFRSPEPGLTRAALLGSVFPGEVSLAHRGVLFLDEFPELRRDCLEGLRAPLESGEVLIARARVRTRYPARFTLIAAMNPCPCGYHGDRERVCRCSSAARHRYQSRFSGPLRDRIDLQVHLSRLSATELIRSRPGESSETVRQRVLQARERQAARGVLNAQLDAALLRRYCPLDEQALAFLEQAVGRLGLSARVFDRVRRMARTLADLRGAEAIETQDIVEAVEYRCLDRELSMETERTPFALAEGGEKSCA